MKLIKLTIILGIVWIGLRLFSFYALYMPKVQLLPEHIRTSLSANGFVYTELKDVPQTFVQALVSTEDRRFYQHHGLDLRGLARAVYVNLMKERFAEGGSTITQQLARGQFLTRRKSVERKLKEMLLALAIERFFTKDEILEMYLNQAYFGHGAHGIGQAAKIILGKPIQTADLAENALLAGLLRGPSLYDPYLNPDLAKNRQKQVLQNMAETGVISTDTAEAAYGEKIPVLTPKAGSM